MARSTTTQTITTITDSLTGANLNDDNAVEVFVVIDGQGYALDLDREKSLKQFEAAISKFTKDEATQTMRVTRPTVRAQARFPEGYLKAVRVWAAEQNITVPKVGVVPKGIIAQYEAAQA